MPKQTAVQWLVMTYNQRQGYIRFEDIDKAKEMEKEQLINAVYDGMGTNFDPNMGRAEQYYKEIYENNK
jgi:glutamyl/glutaminyl-tRNA synthetase